MAFVVRYPPLEKRFETRSEVAADPRSGRDSKLEHGDDHSQVSGLRPLRARVGAARVRGRRVRAVETGAKSGHSS